MRMTNSSMFGLIQALITLPPPPNYFTLILDNLRTSGVQQPYRKDKITFSALVPWPGDYVCADGRFVDDNESGDEMRAAITIGSEFGLVTRPDLVAPA